MGITQTNKETHLNFKTTILEALNHHKFIHNHHKAAQRNIFEMGAVVSCIKSLFQTIGACIMAVVNGIAGMLKATQRAMSEHSHPTRHQTKPARLPTTNQSNTITPPNSIWFV